MYDLLMLYSNFTTSGPEIIQIKKAISLKFTKGPHVLGENTVDDGFKQ